MLWLNTQVLAQHTTPPVAKPIAQPAPLSKPKFEFYTLLTNDHGGTNTASATHTASATAISPSSLPSTPTGPIDLTLNKVATRSQDAEKKTTIGSDNPHKNAFLVQLGSFKSKQEAERIKASLSLKGFSITVAAVSQKNITWYRVMTGPYSSRIEAEKAQISIAKSERMVGMIRRMDA
jgi:cell division protein FtsN